jgi:ATPase subunit of ABC transporter with duplicated ATPase domains
VLTFVDAEVQTITSLTNVQNSLFIPNLGRFVNRRPTYVLRPTQSEQQSLEEINKILAPARQAQTQAETQDQAEPRMKRTESSTTMATVATIDSQLSESRFAVLPHGTSLEGWTKEDKAELNDHVRHMLHSRRSKFKRSMRGFAQYVRRRK